MAAGRAKLTAKDAAEALKLTAEDLKQLGVIDEIVAEPLGGAHRARGETATRLGDAIEAALAKFDNQPGEDIRGDRRQKFLDMGRQGLNA